MTEPAPTGLRLSPLTLSIAGVVGVPLFAFAISVLGEVRTNRLRLDNLELQVARLAQRDEESARDRRELDGRIYRLEDGHGRDDRLAPARGRE